MHDAFIGPSPLHFWSLTKGIHRCQTLKVCSIPNRHAGATEAQKKMLEHSPGNATQTERWLELCFSEWLQWLQWSPGRSPHPQLLDVAWCSQAVAVIVV